MIEKLVPYCECLLVARPSRERRAVGMPNGEMSRVKRMSFPNSDTSRESRLSRDVKAFQALFWLPPRRQNVDSV